MSSPSVDPAPTKADASVLESIGSDTKSSAVVRTLEEQRALLETTTTTQSTITVEGGNLQDRLQLLQEQRVKDAQTISYTTDESKVTKELIQDRLEWIQQEAQKNKKPQTTTEQQTVSKALVQDRLSWMQQEAQKNNHMTAKNEKLEVEGGNLQDRLQLLQQQRERDAQTVSYTTDESQVTKELIHDRLKWMEQESKKKDSLPQREEILVEGGKLQDRLKALEEQRQLDAKTISYTTDESQVTKELIYDRLKWMEQEAKKANISEKEKEAIVVEGGKLQDRLRALEEQRQLDARTISYTTDESQVTKELIYDRLKWIEQESKKDNMTEKEREAIVVEGGKLQDRLRALEEQRQLDARTISYTTDESQVTKELIYDRLKWIEQESKKGNMTEKEREAIVVEGGKLQDRLKALEEQQERDAAKLIRFSTDLSSKMTDEFIRDRLQWMEEQQKKNEELPAQAQAIVSHELVAERMQWLRENVTKANELPEKERLEITKNLVAQRQAWLDEAKEKAAQLPPKELISVTKGLINERIMWLGAQKEKASSLSHAERRQMTSGLISERLSMLKKQYAENKTEDIQMQITFLSEQTAQLPNMDPQQQLVMTSALLDEKVQDLETQKEITPDLTAEQQIEVTNLLIEDRQAWLEGDDDLIAKENESEDQYSAVDAEKKLDDDEVQVIMNNITFWTEQKNSAAGLTAAAQSEIATFLIQEHIKTLEERMKDADDATETDNLNVQISFLMDQKNDAANRDDLTMINALIDEKIAELKQQLPVFA